MKTQIIGRVTSATSNKIYNSNEEMKNDPDFEPGSFAFETFDGKVYSLLFNINTPDVIQFGKEITIEFDPKDVDATGSAINLPHLIVYDVISVKELDISKFTPKVKNIFKFSSEEIENLTRVIKEADSIEEISINMSDYLLKPGVAILWKKDGRYICN
jgi:hypothetical protein